MLSDGSTFTSPEFIHQYPVDQWGEFPVILYVENASGCKDSVVQMIEIRPDYTLYIPNAFTPNEDDNNDYFHISGVNLPPEDFSIRIYNRWGNLVFVSSDPAFRWDGKSNDGYVPPGSYVIKLQFRDTMGNYHVQHGEIVVIY